MAIIKGLSPSTSSTSSPIAVNKYKSSYDVYIGRGSIWGNPFTVQEHGRDRCIQLYKEYIIERLCNEPELVQQLLSLRGKRLGCFCKPQACHGDVLVELYEHMS